MTVENTEVVSEEQQETTGQEAEESTEQTGQETEGGEAGAEAAAEGEGEQEGEGTPDEEEKPDGKGHARKGGWQRKIEKLERDKALLLDALAQKREGVTPQTAAPPKEKTPQEQAEEYVDALVEKRIAEREARAQLQSTVAKFQERTQAVRAQHPDFDEVLASSDTQVPQALQQALLTSEHGPSIMYQLAKNPDELARLARLPPLDAAREVGRLEARASVTAAPKPALKPTANRPPAPAPITPVKGRGPATGKRASSYEEYCAQREAELYKR